MCWVDGALMDENIWGVSHHLHDWQRVESDGGLERQKIPRNLVL